MQRLWIALGALAGLTAVAMAALAAHGLDWLDPAALQMVRSTLEMHGWHALALLACGLWAPRGGRLVDWAGAAFVVGLLLASGAAMPGFQGTPRCNAVDPDTANDSNFEIVGDVLRVTSQQAPNESSCPKGDQITTVFERTK